LFPNDIAARKTGRPRIYTNKEIKEQRKISMAKASAVFAIPLSR